MRNNKPNGESKIRFEDFVVKSKKNDTVTVIDNFERLGKVEFAKLSLHALEASKSSKNKH